MRPRIVPRKVQLHTSRRIRLRIQKQCQLCTFQVKYGDKVVDLGNELTPTETQQVPEIHYKHEGGVLYTLVMTGKPEFRSSRSETDKI